jgi:hypothetical protein
MPPLPQPLVLDLLSLAVGKTALKDQMPLEEFRSTIAGQFDELLSGDRLRLQVVWNLFSPKTGFDPKVAACPMCWLKTLENRLGVAVELPNDLAGLKSSDVATNAAKVFVRREDVDKLLGPDSGAGRVRQTTPLPTSYVRAAVAAPAPVAQFNAVEPGALPIEPGAPPVEPGAPPAPSLTSQVVTVPAATSRPMGVHHVEVTARQKTYGMIAAGVFLVSVAVIGLTFRGTCAKPPTTIELRTAVMPVKAGQQFGHDAQFVLADPAWLTTGTEAERATALRAALTDLHGRGVDNLSIVDANGKLRASAQWTGTDARVRFY